MRRMATSLRNEQQASTGAAAPPVVDARPWGFVAVDGLPDLEAAPAYRRRDRDQFGRLLLTNGSVACGFDHDLLDELAKIHISAHDLATVHDGGSPSTGCRTLSRYEIEVCDAMVARRDAAVRLSQMLVEDASNVEGSLDAVRNGLVMELLAPAVGGSFRRCLSEAMSEFESTRHRFRLALVAVAIDNGMTAVDIGAAFAFSRQLASRYLKEARAKWPELAGRRPTRPAHD